MKSARMLLGLALVVGASHIASGQDTANGQQEQMRRDQLRIAVQDICPTSGQKLGAHGQPIKVKVGEETVFLCCEGCLKKQLNPQHWATIHANFAKAQQICPVMEHELPKNPKWTLVDGQIVFVCCPPCTKKIVADPKTYLQKVDQLYTASLEAERVRR
jgi:hypothetical protein